jgi:hypothetical protein
MGNVTNATDEELEVRPLRCILKPGETVDVDDDTLSAHQFAYPNFLVNGRKRVGPFEDVSDYSDPKYLDSETPAAPVRKPIPAPVVPADPEVTE